jgi:5-amino-6-(5-phospho-D-ribitylamino)uracil phosphatase
MSEIKLVLTDIDGTLVWHGQHHPTEAVSRAISNVQEAGIELTAATGRPYEMMHNLFEQLGFRDLGIFDAGASIRDIKTGELQWSNWLDVDRIKSIASFLLPHATLIDYYPTYKEVSAAEADIENDAESAPYVFAFVKEESREEIISKLATVPDITYHIGLGLKDKPGLIDIQITDKNSDKFHAVNALRNLVHSEKTQTLAIGDSTNDLPLFRNAGIKIAMGNAMEELKREADFIVGDVDEDGFAEAMERFVLS